MKSLERRLNALEACMVPAPTPSQVFLSRCSDEDLRILSVVLGPRSLNSRRNMIECLQPLPERMYTEGVIIEEDSQA